MVSTISPLPALPTQTHTNILQSVTYKPYNQRPHAFNDKITPTIKRQTPRIHPRGLHGNLPSKTPRNSNYRSHPANSIKSPEPRPRIKPITLHHVNISGTIKSIFVRIRMMLLISCVAVGTLGVWGSVSGEMMGLLMEFFEDGGGCL